MGLEWVFYTHAIVLKPAKLKLQLPKDNKKEILILIKANWISPV